MLVKEPNTTLRIHNLYKFNFLDETAHGRNFIATIWFVVNPPAWCCCSKFPPHDVIIVCASLMMHYGMYLALLDMSWLPGPRKMLPNSLCVVPRMLLIQNLSSALCGNHWEVCAINVVPVRNKFSFNRPMSQIPQCIMQISHNAPLCNRNVQMCAHFCYKMLHCGIWDWCIMGFVHQLYSKRDVTLLFTCSTQRLAKPSLCLRHG